MCAEAESGCAGSEKEIKAVIRDGKVGDKEAEGL